MSSSKLIKILNISIAFTALFHSGYSMDLDNSSSNRTASTGSLYSQKEDIKEYNQIQDSIYNEKINLPKSAKSYTKVTNVKYYNKHQLLKNMPRLALARIVCLMLNGKLNDNIILIIKPKVLHIIDPKDVLNNQINCQYAYCTEILKKMEISKNGDK